MNELIGRTITGIAIGDGEHHLKFSTTAPGELDFFYVTVAECCSHSWFAEINGVSALLGHTVRDVREVAMDKVLPGPYDDVHKFYCIVITTEGGRADIIFRNRSNGYYGGDVEMFDDQWHDPLPDVFRTITEDWSA